MRSLLRRVLIATDDWDERSELRVLVGAGPAASCAVLGSVLSHVLTTLARDRRLMDEWLDERVDTTS
jgi:hypothetical protein